MLKIGGILVIAIIIIALEVPYLLKNKLKREMWAFSILLIIAIGLSIAMALNVNIPNPIDLISTIFKPFSWFLYDYLLK
ncbi:hypothetical protein ABET41_09975 [Metabacillus fastidiosus]|uniref:Uncharacterized protein n=1 Tax=Metabacillus fastidiosus TaxID=1458 RepID=A0ABU6NU28_9BACI|nr:hypothetical protein [Metabacillus fastidiosus]MED4399887.1 hypothetical protein [Metabacillus fastidiosus]MED4462371.1 hypothetical protein [Metabacillus fastidiosus]MED4531693.1 hypothetical protein [Metabacillus fastidiosus]